jgi:hypothetical protein
MAWSEKAIAAAIDHVPMYTNFPERVRRALDAAAAVDGDDVRGRSIHDIIDELKAQGSTEPTD